MSNWLLPCRLVSSASRASNRLLISPDRTYIGLDGEGFPARRFNLFDDGGCGFGVLLEIDNDHCPFLGQADGDGSPDATAGPRYHERSFLAGSLWASRLLLMRDLV